MKQAGCPLGGSPMDTGTAKGRRLRAYSECDAVQDREIHFVHLKEGTDPQSPNGDSYAVLGVLCQEDSAAPLYSTACGAFQAPPLYSWVHTGSSYRK